MNLQQNKKRENLIQFADQARLSRSLVTLKKDVSVISTIDDFKINSSLDTKKLIPFLKSHGFKSLLNKYENYEEQKTTEQFGLPQTIVMEEQKDYENLQDYQLIDTIEKLKKFLTECSNQSVISIDCETNSLNAKSANLIGISMSLKEGIACYIPLRHGNNLKTNEPDLITGDSNPYKQIPFSDVINLIKPLLEDTSILKILSSKISLNVGLLLITAYQFFTFSKLFQSTSFK